MLGVLAAVPRAGADGQPAPAAHGRRARGLPRDRQLGHAPRGARRRAASRSSPACRSSSISSTSASPTRSASRGARRPRGVPRAHRRLRSGCAIARASTSGVGVFARVHRAFGPRMRILVTGGSRFDPAIARDLLRHGPHAAQRLRPHRDVGRGHALRPGDRFTTSVGHPLPGVTIRIAPDAAASADGARRGRLGRNPDRGPGRHARVLRPARRHGRGARWTAGSARATSATSMPRAASTSPDARRKSSSSAPGKNLYPEEIEAHYRQSPFIKELCVLGLTEPGVPAAERLHAVIVADDDALRARGIVNLRELIRFEIEGLRCSCRRTSASSPTTSRPRRSRAHRRASSSAGRSSALSEARDRPMHRRRPRAAHARRPGVARRTRTRRALVDAMRTRLERPRRSARRPPRARPAPRLDGARRTPRAPRAAAGHARAAPRRARRSSPCAQLVDAVLAAPAAGDADAAADRAPKVGPSGRRCWRRRLIRRSRAIWRRPTFWRALVFYLFLRRRPSVRLVCYGPRCNGPRHICPRRGPYIITPNHQAYLDGFLLAVCAAVLVLRQLFFVGASEYFESPLMRRLARAANIVPVDPDANLVTAMQAAAAGLRLRTNAGAVSRGRALDRRPSEALPQGRRDPRVAPRRAGRPGGPRRPLRPLAARPALELAAARALAPAPPVAARSCQPVRSRV